MSEIFAPTCTGVANSRPAARPAAAMPRNVLSGCLQSNIARERTQSASSERANHAQSFKGKSECARHCAGTLLKHRGAARQPPWSRALHAPVQRPQGAAGSASGQAARTVPWSSSRSCPGVLFGFLVSICNLIFKLRAAASALQTDSADEGRDSTRKIGEEAPGCSHPQLVQVSQL